MQGIQYLATVTERGGKVYAFFVKSPTKVSLYMSVVCVVNKYSLALGETLEDDCHTCLVDSMLYRRDIACHMWPISEGLIARAPDALVALSRGAACCPPSAKRHNTAASLHKP